MAPDIDMLDEELVRRGVPPGVIKALGLGATPQPATNSDLIAKAGGMSSSQPQPVSFLTGDGAQRDLPAPIERLKENPQGAFVGSPAVSFIRRGSPPGAGPQDNANAPISFTNRQQGNPSDPGAQIASSVSPSDSASRVVRAAFQGNSGTGGEQPIPSLKGENPDLGVSPTSVPETTNAGRMLRSATRPNAGADGTQPTPAIQGSIDAGQVTGGPAAAAGAQPISLAGPAERRFEELEKKGSPQLHGWKKWLDIASQVSPIGQLIERNISGSPGNFNVRLMQAGANATKEQSLGKARQEMETAEAQAQFNTPEKRRTFVKANPDLLEGADKFQINEWVATGNKFPAREPTPKTERPETLDREAYDYYVGQGMSPADARKRVLQDAQSVKPAGHTSAFEAFAYGSPEEKKAAQDFLDMEKRLGSRYKNPSEFEEKYRLFKEDPETYRAMFGDKTGSGPDRANATRMLNYFDKRRREVNGDFTLDDSQKQEQLKEIENLEKPFMEAAQPGSRGGNEDRVTVVHPNGKVGTIPRSQLDKAKKKGYRVQQ